MAESLREQQNALTRDRIMKALASLITDDGVHEFSIQEVADRAGVSHRTVYRHFPSRERLLEALAERVDEQLRERGGVSRPGSPDRLPAAVRDNYRLFEELAPEVEAGVVLAMGARIQPALRRRRSRWFAEDLAGAVAQLDADTAGAVVALLRALGSSRTWFVLTREFGLDTAAAAEVTGWAVRRLIDDLRAGGGPGRSTAAGGGAPSPDDEGG